MIFYLLGLLKIGFKVNQAIDGKNNMGTTSPGNNSGNSIFKGSVIERGITISEKERTNKTKLKTSSAFFLSHFTEAAWIKAMTIQADTLRPMMLYMLTMLEKLASLAKK